jgi:hypothetical protein
VYSGGIIDKSDPEQVLEVLWNVGSDEREFVFWKALVSRWFRTVLPSIAMPEWEKYEFGAKMKWLYHLTKQRIIRAGNMDDAAGDLVTASVIHTSKSTSFLPHFNSILLIILTVFTKFNGFR